MKCNVLRVAKLAQTLIVKLYTNADEIYIKFRYCVESFLAMLMGKLEKEYIMYVSNVSAPVEGDDGTALFSPTFIHKKLKVMKRCLHLLSDFLSALEKRALARFLKTRPGGLKSVQFLSNTSIPTIHIRVDTSKDTIGVLRCLIGAALNKEPNLIRIRDFERNIIDADKDTWSIELFNMYNVKAQVLDGTCCVVEQVVIEHAQLPDP